MKRNNSAISLAVAVLIISLSFRSVLFSYKVNVEESIVSFKVDDVLGAARVGYFNPPKGTIEFDKKKPEKSHFNVRIDVNSLNTNNKTRDKDLLSSSFLSADKYPIISFASKSINKTQKGYETTGTIKIKDVSREIKIPFSFIEEGNLTYFESNFNLNRLDYNVGNNNRTIGNEVKIKLKIVVSSRALAADR